MAMFTTTVALPVLLILTHLCHDVNIVFSEGFEQVGLNAKFLNLARDRKKGSEKKGQVYDL